MPGSADQERLTLRAVRMCAIAVDISLVNVMESHRARDLAGAMQRFGRRARLVLQFEIGMKRREVQRHIGAEMLQNPFRQFARLRRIIVQRRDHQVGDLEPDVGLVFQPLESFEHGLKMRERDFPVEVLGEGFEVHVRGIDVVINVVERFVGDVAVCDHHSVQPVFLGRLADVDHILAPDGGLVVREGERRAAILEGQERNIFGRDMGRVHLIVMRLRDVPVLAEKTAHVAARSAHGKNTRSRNEVVQRLFFDGINLERGGRSVA